MFHEIFKISVSRIIIKIKAVWNIIYHKEYFTRFLTFNFTKMKKCIAIHLSPRLSSIYKHHDRLDGNRGGHASFCCVITLLNIFRIYFLVESRCGICIRSSSFCSRHSMFKLNVNTNLERKENGSKIRRQPFDPSKKKV